MKAATAATAVPTPRTASNRGKGRPGKRVSEMNQLRDNADTLAEHWGVAPVPWLWPVKVKILLVIDGRITQGHGGEEFGLGPVLDTLRDPTFAYWVEFSVDVVKRDPPTRFRFDDRGFDLDRYDQVWLFGDWPGEVANDPAVPDEVIFAEQFSPLNNEELRVLAEWMDRGGGVFAVGDHAMLGASMCSRVPRVRSMRRWTHAQGVPSFVGDDRNETLQAAPLTSDQGDEAPESSPWWEGDRWLQRISPVWSRQNSHLSLFGRYPHPILCGRAGVIDRFPDHMHEGAVVEDNDVALHGAIDIPGMVGVEYPQVPQIATATTTDLLGPTTPHRGPRPHVIAHGTTTNFGEPPRRFGLISVYDGDPVGLGRVAVESTWHHWFSMNLVGIVEKVPAHWHAMQDYYRNIAIWLSRPQQRISMLFNATWGVVVGKQPGAFDKVMSLGEIGERVLDVLGRTAPHCLVSELVAAFVHVEASVEGELFLPRESGLKSMGLAPNIVNQAIVGGIARELTDQAHFHFREKAYGRATRLDEKEVERRSLVGAIAGFEALVTELSEDRRQLRLLIENLRLHPRLNLRL